MFYARDTFSGQIGSPIQNHVPELGGVPAINPVFPTGAIQLFGANNARPHSLADTYVFYPNALPVADMLVTATFTITNKSGLSYVGLCARGSATANETIVARLETATDTLNWYVVVGGGVVASGSFAYAVNNGDVVTFQIQCTGNAATFLANSTTIGTANISALAHAGCGGINCLTTNLLSPGVLISDFSVQTMPTPPTVPTYAQLTPAGPTAMYTPAGTSTLSSVTFFNSARNTIIKGPQADAAWDYIVHTVPPDMIFTTI